MDAGERFQASLKKALGTYTKAEICRISGVARTQIDGYLAGSAVPGLNQAERIALACGATLSDFLSGGPIRRVPVPVVTPQAALQVLAKFVREKS